MKKHIVIIALICLSLSACKKKTQDAAEDASASESSSEGKKGLTQIEMLLPAQKHVGLVVAPATST